jgi:hypothetical protein
VYLRKQKEIYYYGIIFIKSKRTTSREKIKPLEIYKANQKITKVPTFLHGSAR